MFMFEIKIIIITHVNCSMQMYALCHVIKVFFFADFTFYAYSYQRTISNIVSVHSMASLKELNEQ